MVERLLVSVCWVQMVALVALVATATLACAADVEARSR
jgi:hypothetical protein